MIPGGKYIGPSIPSTYAVALAAAAQPGIEIADDADLDMGTNDFGLIIYANFTDWTPASDTVLWEKHDGTNGVRVTLLTTGILRTTINATDFDASEATGLAASASAILTISVVRESASVAGSVTRYAGVDPIGTASAITAGAPTTVSNAVSAYIGGDGSNQQAGNYIQVVALNFAPTAADVRTVCTTGIPESWKWGSQAAVYASNFSAGVDSWLASGAGTLAGNVDAVSDGSVSKDNCLRFTSGASTGTKAFYKTSSFVSAKKNGAVMYVYVPAGQSYIDGFRVYADSNSGTLVYDGAGQNGSWIEIDVSFVPVGTALVVYCYDGTSVSINALGSGEIVYVVGVETKKLGATLALLPNSIPTSGATAWDDSSGNTGGGTLPAAGATKVTIRK